MPEPRDESDDIRASLRRGLADSAAGRVDDLGSFAQYADGAAALRASLVAITPHNGTPVTAENLRWAATHEALCRSWIFDVLTGLADVFDAMENADA